MSTLDQLQKNMYKFSCYFNGALRRVIPPRFWQRRLIQVLDAFEQLDADKKQDILRRVNYYNKLNTCFTFPERMDFNCQLYACKKSSAYAMDFKKLIGFFPPTMNYSYLFGDIVKVPDFPTFLKSRPICADQENENSVLLKLNKIRHYYVVDDKLKFEDKMPRLVWRGKSNQPERVELLQRFYCSSVCDVGDTHYKDRRTVYERPFLSIPQQLQYKYVLSIEGIDVATNLKWIMASNSLCFMRKPRYETWFMEGTLIPNFHYVLLRDDHSDMEEKISFYNSHPEEAKEIISNANRYVAQFFDEKNELIVSLLVMQKYFALSGQM
jgi:hypothetical protein